jgi:hypothetical protein
MTEIISKLQDQYQFLTQKSNPNNQTSEQLEFLNSIAEDINTLTKLEIKQKQYIAIVEKSILRYTSYTQAHTN